MKWKYCLDHSHCSLLFSFCSWHTKSCCSLLFCRFSSMFGYDNRLQINLQPYSGAACVLLSSNCCLLYFRALTVYLRFYRISIEMANNIAYTRRMFGTVVNIVSSTELVCLDLMHLIRKFSLFVCLFACLHTPPPPLPATFTFRHHKGSTTNNNNNSNTHAHTSSNSSTFVSNCHQVQTSPRPHWQTIF